MEVTRTFDILAQLKELYPKQDILAGKKEGKWIKYSVDDYIQNAYHLAYGFLELGLQPDDKVITASHNCPQWNFIDMGLTLAGLVHVPIYVTLSPEDYLHIIPHSDAKLIFLGGESMTKKLCPLMDSLTNPPQVYTIDPVPGYRSLAETTAIGVAAKEKWEAQIARNVATIDPETIASIIYTSGTTGMPKGVMLSHRALVFEFIGTAVQQIRDYRHKMLSFLPLCHIYERSMNYEYQYLGISTYYAENMGTIASDLHDIQADGFCAVPRVLEMMFQKIEAAEKEQKGIARKIYHWALHLAQRFNYEHNNLWYRIQHFFAEKLVYVKWREKLGGKEMLVVTGGSSIQPRIIRLFSAAKLYIFEGYGMTETAPVIAVNNPKEHIIKIGTVGKVMDGTEVKIAEDGEILTRGPHLMSGYYKDPEYTKEVIDTEGWFHTGDVGRFVDDIFLQITDRKKEIFKLSSGKYVAPQVIENKLKESSFVENVMVIGENHKTASAIIVPDLPTLRSWAKEQGLSYTDDHSLILLPEVIKHITNEVEKTNKSLAFHEQIRKPKLSIDEWTPVNGFLSQTLKLKRNVLIRHYADLINEIYRHED
ncbi:MAG: long-chain fatty acid--CoA ligase [Bacteroidetes bacterium]|nr:long-chain fatty acid--CoA ligase [Bacteroidota bacterium]